MRRRAAWFLLAAIVVATAACAKKQAAPTKPPVPVAIATVRRADVPVTLNAIGTVAPMQTAAVSAQVDGIITEVAFREGQEVTQHQVLFHIDPRPYAAAYNQARANLERDRATAINAQKEVERYDQLVQKDYVTKEQADQQRATAAAAQATVGADSALLANAQFNLDNTTVRAPIAGRTGNLLVRAGNLVHGSAGTTLVVINQIHPILVQFAVPSTNLPDIQKYTATGPLPVSAYQVAQAGTTASQPAATDSASGDQATGTPVTPPAAGTGARTQRGGRYGGAAGGRAGAGGPPSLSQGGGGTAAGGGPVPSSADSTDANGIATDQSGGGPPGGGVTSSDASSMVPSGPAIAGTLSFVNNAVDTATGTVLLKATFGNPKGDLWPGEYVATVLRLYVQQGALVVPSQAVMTGQQGTYVFVIDATTNTARQRSVVVGRATDSLSVVNSGLTEGEHVVTDGQSRLQNGAKVNVRATSSAPGRTTASVGSGTEPGSGSGSASMAGSAASRRATS